MCKWHLNCAVIGSNFQFTQSVCLDEGFSLHYQWMTKITGLIFLWDVQAHFIWRLVILHQFCGCAPRSTCFCPTWMGTMVLWSSEGLRARDGGDMEQMVEWWLKLTRVETPPDVNSKVARLDNWHFSSLDNAKRNTCLEFSNTVPAHMPCFRCDGQVERSRKPPGLDQFRVIGLNFIGCITASKTQKMVQELCWTKILHFLGRTKPEVMV